MQHLTVIETLPATASFFPIWIVPWQFGEVFCHSVSTISIFDLNGISNLGWTGARQKKKKIGGRHNSTITQYFPWSWCHMFLIRVTYKDILFWVAGAITCHTMSLYRISVWKANASYIHMFGSLKSFYITCSTSNEYVGTWLDCNLYCIFNIMSEKQEFVTYFVVCTWALRTIYLI